MILGREGNMSTMSSPILRIVPHLLTANYTEEEGQIYATLLVRLCDLVASLVLILHTSMGKFI